MLACYLQQPFGFLPSVAAVKMIRQSPETYCLLPPLYHLHLLLLLHYCVCMYRCRCCFCCPGNDQQRDLLLLTMTAETVLGAVHDCA